jgi:hypothetical protein
VNHNKIGAARSGVDGPRTMSCSRRNVYVSAIVALVVVASTLAATPAHAGGSVGAVGTHAVGTHAVGTRAVGTHALGTHAGGTDTGGMRRAGVDPAAVEQVLRDAGAVVDVGVSAASRDRLVGPDVASPDAASADAASPDAASPDAARPGGAASGVSTAAVSLESGLAVATGANTLRIQPMVARAAKAMSPGGLAVYGNTPESAFALSSAETGGNAGYVVISGPTAPDAYRFMFTVDGRPAVLKLAADGGVEVYSSSGVLVNSIVPAWARDANGAELSTSYSVSRNILTQRVSHTGAAYPVVADPRVRCDGLWCTLELTRNETRLLAASALSPGIACRFLGPGAAACAGLLISGWAQANIALSRGQCTGVRVWQANMVSYPHLAYIRCYA